MERATTRGQARGYLAEQRQCRGAQHHRRATGTEGDGDNES